MHLAYALIVALLLAGCGKPSAPVVEAQSASIVELKFTTKFYDAVDKRVAFKTDKDSLYLAGIISLSNKKVAFTFQPEAIFAITNNGLERLKENSDNLELKLDEKNINVVAILSEKEIEQLRLLKEPENGLSPITLDYAHDLSPMGLFRRNYGKCCCSKDAVGDKNCENILWRAIDHSEKEFTEEEFQKMVVTEDGIKLLCAVLNSRSMCGSCSGLKCPGEKEGCRENIGIDDLDDLDDEL